MKIYSKKDICEQDIFNFLKDNDLEFPIPLSEKINLKTYAKKILKNGEIFFTKNDEMISGMVTGYINDYESGQSYISVLVVSPNYRGNGIAKILVNEFIKESIKKQMNSLFLHTHPVNKTAIKFYENLGFSFVKENNITLKGEIILRMEIV